MGTFVRIARSTRRRAPRGRRGVVLALLTIAAWCGIAPAGIGAQTGAAGGGERRVELLYAEPGAEVDTWLGHVAVALTDPSTGVRYVYHFGSFDRGPRTIRAVLRGHAVAHVRRRAWDVEVERLRRAGRRTTALELRLSDAQAESLAASLERARIVLARGYAYDYLHDNCATRLRDLLDAALNGALRRATVGRAPVTARAYGFEFLARRSVGSALIADLLLGAEGDRPIDEWQLAAFPRALQTVVERTRVPAADGASLPLVVRRRILVDVPVVAARAEPPAGRAAPAVRVVVVLGLVGLTVATALGARGGRPWARLTLGVASAASSAALGLAGLVLAFAWAATAYTFAARNANLLLASPLALVLVAPSIRYAAGTTTRPVRLAWGWSCLALLGAVAALLAPLPGAPQDTTRIAALALPLLLGHAAALHYAGDGAVRTPIHTRRALVPRSLSPRAHR